MKKIAAKLLAHTDISTDSFSKPKLIYQHIPISVTYYNNKLKIILT